MKNCMGVVLDGAEKLSFFPFNLYRTFPSSKPWIERKLEFTEHLETYLPADTVFGNMVVTADSQETDDVKDPKNEKFDHLKRGRRVGMWIVLPISLQIEFQSKGQSVVYQGSFHAKKPTLVSRSFHQNLPFFQIQVRVVIIFLNVSRSLLVPSRVCWLKDKYCGKC